MNYSSADLVNIVDICQKYKTDIYSVLKQSEARDINAWIFVVEGFVKDEFMHDIEIQNPTSRYKDQLTGEIINIRNIFNEWVRVSSDHIKKVICHRKVHLQERALLSFDMIPLHVNDPEPPFDLKLICFLKKDVEVLFHHSQPDGRKKRWLKLHRSIIEAYDHYLSERKNDKTYFHPNGQPIVSKLSKLIFKHRKNFPTLSKYSITEETIYRCLLKHRKSKK